MISYLQSHGDMSKIRSLVYIPDIQNLQTRILLFPNQKKKNVKTNSGQSWTFYEYQ